MPRYRVMTQFYHDRMYGPGEIVTWDGPAGSNLELIEDEEPSTGDAASSLRKPEAAGSAQAEGADAAALTQIAPGVLAGPEQDGGPVSMAQLGAENAAAASFRKFDHDGDGRPGGSRKRGARKA